VSALETETLYYGDCLDWMPQWDDQSVDLIYLDPPFNSKTDYNVLYSTEGETAQFQAFSDTWSWDEAAVARRTAYEGAPARSAHDAIAGLGRVLGPSGMLAYLTYMAERLEHMHRLLKPTGSVYLHCDPTASHYLKIVLDGIFGGSGFINEISWRRTSTKGDYRQGATNWPRIRDVILHYGRSAVRPFNQPFGPYSQQYIDSHYNRVDGSGRRYQLDNLTAPGAGSRGHPR